MRRFMGLLLILAACGDDSPVRHLDGGTHDASAIDAPGPTTVRLMVSSGATPRAGVHVYFQNADSSLVSSTVTDASGVASAVMQAGGFVTAITPFSTGDLYTFAGVKPGDRLVLKQPSAAAPTAVTFTADLDGDPAITGYMFQTKCGSTIVAPAAAATQAQVTLNLTADCLTAVDTVVAALDANNEVVRYFYVPQAPVAGAAVDLTGRAYMDPATAKTYTYSNLVGGMTELSLIQQLSSATGPVVSLTGATAGGTVTLQLPAFMNAGDLVFAMGPTTFGSHGFIDWGPTVAATLDVDVGMRALTETTGFPVYDATVHAATWTPDVGGEMPDVAIMNASATRATPAQDWTWQIVVPYTAGSVAYPVLPVESSGPDYNIGATDTATISSLTLAKVPGGYDGIRGAAFAAGGLTSTITTASGSITLEDIAQGPGRVKPGGRRPATSRPSAWQPSRRM